LQGSSNASTFCPNKILGTPRCRSTQDRQKPDIPSSISGFLVGAFVYLSDCWRKRTLRPLWFGVARHHTRQWTQPINLIAESKFARKNLKKQSHTKIFWVLEKKLRNYHAEFLSLTHFENRKSK
jgi:hypothetical protein